MPAKSEERLAAFLRELSETLDLDRTIKKLDITRHEAREMLAGLVPERRVERAAHGGAYEVFVDGASRGNPGLAGAGVVIRDGEGNVVKKLRRYLGVVTNNVAEYQALVAALEAARELRIARIRIFADSELMVKQLTGVYRVKSPELKPLYEKARALLEGFAGFEIKHVYREENSVADSLANEAIDRR